MTSRLRPRLSACPLPLSLVGARLVEIAPTPGPSESPVAGLSADFPADSLRVARRGLRDKGRAALGTSATRGHRASVAPAQIMAAFPAARWITLRPPGPARSPGHVGHDPAAKWITRTRPLKNRAQIAMMLVLAAGTAGCVTLLGDFDLAGSTQDGGADDATSDGAAVGVVEGHDDAGAVCACLSHPPAGWAFVAMSTSAASCTGAWAGASSTIHDGLTAADATCGCACAPSGTACTVSFSYDVNCMYACSGGCSGSPTNVTLASGACVPAAVQANVYEALSNPMGNGSCAPQPTTTIPPVAWTTTVTTCDPTSAIGHGTCGIGSACVPAAPSGSRVCIQQAGDLPCPVGTKQVEYAGVADTRACSACTCGAPTGAACGGSTVGYATPDCSGASFLLACGPAANSVRYTAAPSGTCAPPGPVAATGDAMPNAPITLCCL